MAKRKDIGDEEIVRFQRFKVVESAAGVFTQQSYDTQLSIDRGFVWMIHWLEAEMNATQIDDPAQDGYESIAMQITRESQTGLLELSDPDCIMTASKVKDRTATIGTDTGPVIVLDSAPIVYSWPLPLIYAATEIHVGVQGSSAAVKSVAGRIAYTIRKVSDKFFYRVAQALIS